MAVFNHVGDDMRPHRQ